MFQVAEVRKSVDRLEFELRGAAAERERLAGALKQAQNEQRVASALLEETQSTKRLNAELRRARRALGDHQHCNRLPT
jgi:hypothetical protein